MAHKGELMVCAAIWGWDITSYVHKMQQQQPHLPVEMLQLYISKIIMVDGDLMKPGTNHTLQYPNVEHHVTMNLII